MTFKWKEKTYYKTRDGSKAWVGCYMPDGTILGFYDDGGYWWHYDGASFEGQQFDADLTQEEWDDEPISLEQQLQELTKRIEKLEAGK